jgi:5'(3')-deoxyribonucleotidase
MMVTHMTADESRFVLGVDLDGVVADFYGALRPIAAEWFGVDVDTLPMEVSYGLKEWGITSRAQYDDLHRFAVTQQDLFLKEQPVASAAATLRRLGFNDSIRVRIITHRLYIKYTHEICVQHTTRWLESNGIPYWDICFMKEKGDVGADLYIEDSPTNIAALKEARKDVLIFSNSTNRSVEGERADSWADVERIVLNKVGQWKANRRVAQR